MVLKTMNMVIHEIGPVIEDRGQDLMNARRGEITKEMKEIGLDQKIVGLSTKETDMKRGEGNYQGHDQMREGTRIMQRSIEISQDLTIPDV